MRALVLLAVVLASAGPAAAQELDGPPGTSDAKVLVIGLDGTRIDLVQQLIDADRAPNLAALQRDGFLVPSLLDYAPPEALTLSEVGWSSIATGVWPAKHGVSGYMLNQDPGQATKNGFLDFLSHIESVRPALSTFLASDWSNIGLHQNGGPIFGDDIDARYALAAADSIEAYDEADADVTRESARYLRSGDPDAGFVYYGVIDEVAHLAGSATPRYLKAIEDTDARIGRLLDAIRTRPTYLEERWIVLLTSDHGQQDFNVPSIASHGGGTDLERTSFVGVAGFGAPSSAPDPRIVDIAPTVYRWLGVPQAEDLDGKALLDAVPAPAPVARVKGTRVLRIQIRARRGAPALRKLRIRAAGKLTRAQAGRATKIRIKGRRRVIVTPDPGARIVTVRLTGEQPIRRARVRVTDAGGTTTLIPVVAGR